MLSDRICVRRGGPLHGSVRVPGAKNSVLKLMAAALLGDGSYTLSNVPDIADVAIMSELLDAIGVTAGRDLAHPDVVRLTNTSRITPVAPAHLVERIRASINVLGPLLGRYGEVTLAMPGGDDFGSRPIDMHIGGLEAMGAEFSLSDTEVRGRIAGGRQRLHGAEITLPFPSVGATENLLTAAVHADGRTVIDNVAREPEIQDLCHLLVSMGAAIEGIGTATLTIDGVRPGELHGVEHRVVPDRIQAATYVAAVGVSGGEITIEDARPAHMATLLRRCADIGLHFGGDDRTLTVSAPERLRPTDFATLPYPGIATDYKPLLVTMLAVADGLSIVTENLYPGRFRYVDELTRMGADIEVEGHHAVIRGVAHLHGATVEAPDIRAGAALVVAGLAATGETTVTGVHHIDRGYDDLVGRLVGLGADIQRVSAESTRETPRRQP